VVAPALQVELPTMMAMTSNPDPAVGEECQKTSLDTSMENPPHNIVGA
jgi:hypothetical protein